MLYPLGLTLWERAAYRDSLGPSSNALVPNTPWIESGKGTLMVTKAVASLTDALSIDTNCTSGRARVKRVLLAPFFSRRRTVLGTVPLVATGIAWIHSMMSPFSPACTRSSAELVVSPPLRGMT